MIVGAILTAILVLFAFIYPHRIKYVLAGLAIVWIGTAVSIYLETVRTAERLLKIVATAAIDPTCPDPKSPLRLTFRNDNTMAVHKITYTIEGFEQAFRSAVSYDGYQVSNIPLNAGESYSACRPYRMRSNESSNPANLDWLVTVNSAQFE